MPYQIRIRRDTAANWTAADPTLGLAEMGYETDTGQLKFGDGATAWTGLSYFTGAGVAYYDNETPAGAVNGVNTAYTLAASPSPAASLMLFLNGQVLRPGGADYTLVGAAITMVIAPFTGDILRAWYRA